VTWRPGWFDICRGDWPPKSARRGRLSSGHSSQSDERWADRADRLFAHFTAAGFSPDEAERLGYGNLLFEWHAEHARRAGRKQCAECGQQGGPLMPAGDGNFLCYFRRECFASYSHRWREEAADTLRELGIGPPGAPA
jgi:hypothetical protein